MLPENDDTDDESDDQELEAHYMYMAKLQQVSPDVDDSGPIFDTEPEQKIDQNKDDADLAEERELLASLIAKLKCEIDESKNRNTLLETSNKVLVEKLKSEIADFKNKNKSLIEANNKLFETIDLLYADFKKSKAKLKRHDSIEYATKMELKCTKVKERSRVSHITVQKEKKSFNIQPTLLEKQLDESIPLGKKCKSSQELFNVVKPSITIANGVEMCKKSITKSTYFGYLDPFIKNTIEQNFSPEIEKVLKGLNEFQRCLKEEMVADLRYFNSLESEVDSLTSQLETQKTQFSNEIDRLSREYYYADHMNAILGVYTELDEVTNLQCVYLELL
uniref:Uncharacterized protein n=1 Tax=Tanacetum cinerariifolium TaxID=118510 RepID=A0A699KUE0_TANCI|nr:hypothetical protein [Tanacetum cinerariifolium]